MLAQTRLEIRDPYGIHDHKIVMNGHVVKATITMTRIILAAPGAYGALTVTPSPAPLTVNAPDAAVAYPYPEPDETGRFPRALATA